MSYSSETEEGLCTTCGEFWAAITGKFFRYAKRGEEGAEVANEASSACKGCACWGIKHLYPARKVVTYYQVVAATVGEEVGELGFKWS